MVLARRAKLRQDKLLRQIDQHGYIRFQDWRLYGERGLASQPVSVWVYEDTLKIEYQTTMLSHYRIERSDDRKRVTEVNHPRLIETIFRSPQLTLFDLGPGEWLLYWRAPAYAPRRKRLPGTNVTQLALFELPLQEKAVGANESSMASSPRTSFRVISRPSDDGGDES